MQSFPEMLLAKARAFREQHRRRLRVCESVCVCVCVSAKPDEALD